MLTKTQMAHRLQISKSYYSMLENGDRRISLMVGKKLHKEFNVPLENIFLATQVHINKTL